MRTCLFTLLCICSLAFLPAAASADWIDNFDTYALGSGLHGQGGWLGWYGDPAANAYVSDVVAFSGPHSMAIAGSSDMVQQFSGYTSGSWVLTAWQYVPTDFTGVTYFILLNTYINWSQNWSNQINFDGVTNLVSSDYDNVTTTLVRGEWVEIRIEIDLTANVQKIYYHGTLLVQKSWTEGVSGGGALDIAALDLYGNSAGPVYYDNLSLRSAEPVPVQTTTWGSLKAGVR